MDRLTCMRAFVAVVESGGFTQAARRIGHSKALISKYVGQLETALDIRLLHRTTRRVTTTTLGQAYYERCRVLLEDLDDLEASVQSQQTRPRGVLKINAPISFAEICLTPILAEYSRRYPDVTMALDMTDRFVDLVEEGVDLAIRIGDLTDSSLVARRLGSTSMIPCASPAYLAQFGEPNTPGELSQHQCVIDTNNPSRGHWWIGSEEEGVRVPVDGPIKLNSARAVRELVVSGQGIGLLPSFVVAKDIQNGTLRKLFSDSDTESFGIYALYTHRKQISAKVRLFIALLQEQLVIR